MHRLGHLGKQPLKFSFELYVCDVRGLPNDVSNIAISFERGGRSVVSATVQTQATGSEERYAMLDERLRTVGTLYRNTKLSRLDPKVGMLRILDMSAGPYGTPGVLGAADFDLAAHAELDPDAMAQQLQLEMPRAARRGDSNPEFPLLLQLSLTSKWLQGTAGLGAEAGARALGRDRSRSEQDFLDTVSAGSSQSSSALTHDALQQHLGRGQLGGPGGNMGGDSRVQAHGKSGKGGKDSGRVAELSQLVAAAASDARQAESRLATLQYRLRSEVLDTTEATLERMRGVSKKDELVKAYHNQFLLIIDQVDRIAYDNGGSLGGGGGVSLLESEVLTLRRDLAASKLEVALLRGENDELNHVARRLNKQLADFASQHR